ncbi:MMPL family transporter [Winogradskya consettensis]|uniref:Membrane protein n=1 Tax=Winogradskya consettensis TaxID=113560 RepID=A0A919SE54_9ACTN|nr:MMPL family transporter [Actinoplanes consettensis]GIM69402.1 membrane protein [Actinoplanes consettensis]
MATLLYRLGRFSFRRRRMVAAVWALVLAVLAAGALTLGGRTVDTFTIPGTESQRALDDLRQDLPAAAGAALTVVVSAPTGQALDSATMKEAVAVVVRRAAALPDVVAATDPVQAGRVDRTGRVGLLSVQYAKSDSELTAADRDAFATLATAGTNGLEVVPGGVSGGPPEIGAREAIGVLIAAVVLMVTFGSLVAAGMTLLTALIGVVAGMCGLLLVTAVVDISSSAPILALMLGLAVGIDYALFLGSRHRAQLADGTAVEESIARATATAGSAVLFAGATVVIALAALSLVGVPFLTAMGLAAAGTVLTAVLVALTLLPALLGFAGLRVLPRSQRRRGAHVRPGFGFRWARGVVRFPRAALVVLVLGLGALSIPALDMRLALPDNGTAPEGSRQRTAYDLVTAAFGPGANGPLLVVVRGTRGDTVSALASRVTAEVRKLQNVTAAGPGPANTGGTTRVVIVTPGTGPTSQETADLVREIRAAVAPLTGADDSVAVTGATAVGVDVSRKMTAALPEYLGVVIGLSFLLLLLAFRSLLVPLKATAGFLLTMGATFGLTVGVFQHGWAARLFGVDRPGPLVSFLPIIMMGVLFGLAMDYEVFIVSRVREEFKHGSNPTEATIAGVGHGARVVTAAALIMAAVFGGFVLIDDPTIKTIGFGLALGVLMDAFLIRMTLVPAVLALLGHRAWAFPRWLDRITPRVDIEGAGLRPPGPAPRHAAPEPELVRARGR